MRTLIVALLLSLAAALPCAAEPLSEGDVYAYLGRIEAAMESEDLEALLDTISEELVFERTTIRQGRTSKLNLGKRGYATVMEEIFETQLPPLEYTFEGTVITLHEDRASATIQGVIKITKNSAGYVWTQRFNCVEEVALEDGTLRLKRYTDIIRD